MRGDDFALKGVGMPDRGMHEVVLAPEKPADALCRAAAGSAITPSLDRKPA
eukprot:gene8584-8675_t